jgi:hypothetical protein
MRPRENSTSGFFSHSLSLIEEPGPEPEPEPEPVKPVGPGIPADFQPVVENCNANLMWAQDDELGKGDVGATYTTSRIPSNPEDREYALKVQEDSTAFRTEVHALVDLKNTGVVVKIHAAWTCDKKGYIVMDKLKECDIEETALYGHIATALKTIDDKGWLHTDVRLENVMCQENGSVVLIDFGSAVKKVPGQDYYPDHYISKDVNFDEMTYDDIKVIQGALAATRCLSTRPEFIGAEGKAMREAVEAAIVAYEKLSEDLKLRGWNGKMINDKDWPNLR